MCRVLFLDGNVLNDPAVVYHCVMNILPEKGPIKAQAMIDVLTAPGRERMDPGTLGSEILRYALNTPEHTQLSGVSNCHVPGMESIVLFASDRGMVRFYRTPPGKHPLSSLSSAEGDFPLGVHNHQYPIVFLPLTPGFSNVDVVVDDRPRPNTPTLHEYHFTSALSSGGAFGLAYQGMRSVVDMRRKRFDPETIYSMNSQDLHTVLIDDTQAPPEGTAWVVLEGAREDVASRFFSHDPAKQLSATGLYLPMDAEDIQRTITSVYEASTRG
jgi:hypothetical protein